LRAGRLVFDGPPAELTEGVLDRIFGDAPPAGCPVDAPSLAAPELAVG
jgi:ABC-type phosphate/phosphonate transport system ATPase subunit